MNQLKRLAILQNLRINNPYPMTDLVFSSPFELLISGILSAKTKDIRVNKVTSNLFSIANTPRKILEIGIEELKCIIKSVGFFNKKAENIIQTCLLLLEKHNGYVPENREDLLLLPGVGRKVANIVLNLSFGWSTIAVDTHVFRVCNRTKFAIGKDVNIVEDKLKK